MTLATNRRLLRPQTLRRRPFASIMGRGFTSHLADVAVLVIGLTATSTVHFVGELPISEVILLALLPILLAVHGRRVLRPEFKALFFLLGLWLFGQVVSDLYRHTATLDWIRGDAAIIFFGLRPFRAGRVAEEERASEGHIPGGVRHWFNFGHSLQPI